MEESKCWSGSEEGSFGGFSTHPTYYDAVLGRFIQPDSIIPEVGNPQAWNRYSYVNNNPVNFNDPSGRMLIDDDKTSCQNKKCLQEEYYYGKEEQDKFDTLIEKERKWREEHQGESNGLMPSVSSIIDTKKFGVGGLDYNFFENGIRDNSIDSSDALNSLINTGEYVYKKWWKPVPAISTVISAFDQMVQDQQMGYPEETQISRVLIAVGEDFIIDLASAAVGTGVTGLTVEAGPASFLFGVASYYQINMFLSQSAEVFNNAYIFPALGLN